MSQAKTQERFVWYELLTSDVDAAKAFYTALIGWGTTDMSAGGQPYTMWTVSEAPVGGLMALPDEAKAAGAPPHWLGYVSTSDVDATAAETSRLGGKVLKEPTDIPDMGRFAILADPQGAVFAVYKAAQEQPADQGTPALGGFSWHELATTDYEAAFEFYSQLFGWKKTDSMDMGEGAIYQMYGAGDTTLGGMYNKTADMPGPPPPAWLYYTTVGSVDESAPQIKELGGQISVGPMDVPGGGRIVMGMDPQGAAFALHSSAGQSG